MTTEPDRGQPVLHPIHQNEGATGSERYLAELARRHFLRLWSYPGLSTIGKRGVTKELVDLTVAFGDDVILFSDKSITWPTHADPDVCWSRWYRAAVAESAKQLWGAERQLREQPRNVFLDPECKKEFPYKLTGERTRYHLVAVASGIVRAAKAYFDAIAPGSTGTLMFSATSSLTRGLEQPFAVGDLDPNRTFVHVLDEETLDRLFLELGTLPDFIHYLTEKEKAVRRGGLTLAAGEEEILGFYLQERLPDGFGSLQRAGQDGRALYIPEGEWSMFQRSSAYRVHASERDLSRRWNDVLKEFDIGIVRGDTNELNHVPLELHERALRAAAQENRASRAILASSLHNKLGQVPADVRTSRIVPSLNVKGRLYVFVFVPWISDSATYEEYREYRFALLKGYATVLPLKFENVREAIVLGLQPSSGPPIRSETMILVNYDAPLSDAERASAVELMEREQILDSVPAQSLAHVRPRHGNRIGRNEPCPCGSGKKNKKCCNVSRLDAPTIFTKLL